MIDFNLVGKKLTKYRKEFGLTQDEVAEHLYVTRQLVSKWEKGIGVPSIDCLLELCRLYQTSFEDILCLDESN
ncbi:MAG: helix-turn-helix domain-containing protein [Anaeroplasmataceae bacterium]|nr:helix-turn-helix domain-containing protein [Anaeroplasmataceae bacterium]